ncbi:MAG: hypothetical protein AB2L11_06380 [Syntrophobacteraceae bacterium]
MSYSVVMAFLNNSGTCDGTCDARFCSNTSTNNENPDHRNIQVFSRFLSSLGFVGNAEKAFPDTVLVYLIYVIRQRTPGNLIILIIMSKYQRKSLSLTVPMPSLAAVASGEGILPFVRPPAETF